MTHKAEASEMKAAGARKVQCYRCHREATGSYIYPDGRIYSACDLHKNK